MSVEIADQGCKPAEKRGAHVPTPPAMDFLHMYPYESVASKCVPFCVRGVCVCVCERKGESAGYVRCGLNHP
jgi:hypothetical protein